MLLGPEPVAAPGQARVLVQPALEQEPVQAQLGPALLARVPPAQQEPLVRPALLRVASASLVRLLALLQRPV